MVLVMEKWFQGFFGYRSLVATAIVGFAIALGFIPLRNRVQRFVDHHFFKQSQAELEEENEKLRREIERTEQLKAVATLAAGLAHEIKNPLASIKTFAEYLPEKYEDPAFRRKFADILRREVDKVSALVYRLLEFARPAQPHLESVELSALVKETLEFLQGTFLERQVRVETAFAEGDVVLADPGQMKQVLLNLLLNSIEAMEARGRVDISTAKKNGCVEVSVADTGAGIRREDLGRIFDPFYTTKRGGSGLGLSVVHSIVREHGGRIDVQSEQGEGTTVHITLPATGGAHGTDTHPDRG